MVCKIRFRMGSIRSIVSSSYVNFDGSKARIGHKNRQRINLEIRRKIQMIKLIDILNEMYPPYKANMVQKVRYKASDIFTNDPKLAVKKGYLEQSISEQEPKKGTGKKPKGSSRRLYTDENPKDTVSVKFKTSQDIKDTLSKDSFKSKPQARKSQIINLIHQRARVAYSRAKDPEVKKRLKRGLDYIEKRKETSKQKTKSLNRVKETSDPQSGNAAPYGSGYAPIK